MLKTFSISLVLLSSFLSPNPGNDWRLRENKDGIQVYSKSVPGSGVDAVKSVYNVNSSVSGVVALVADAASYPKWIYRCSQAKTLKTISQEEFIYYQETSVPWPASNRDLIGHVKISQDPNTKIATITAENMPTFIPEKSGKVRLKVFHEKIDIVPKGKDKSEVTYELFLDPGGNIPAWMVNLAIVDGPFESSRDMIKLINTGAYKNVHLSFIKDL